MIIDGGLVGIGVESTIIDVTEETPTILRPGHITKKYDCQGDWYGTDGCRFIRIRPIGKAESTGYEVQTLRAEGVDDSDSGKKEAVIRRIEELAAEYPKEKSGDSCCG